jgi:redox-sensitive bicupin YhaK (pirin superfamily)
MSWQPADGPRPGAKLACDAIETVIVPRARDLGSFEARRALPSDRRQMVGPFICFDQVGPSEFLLGAGMDVRPHPHIGLSTVTYLFDGEIMHRDVIGSLWRGASIPAWRMAEGALVGMTKCTLGDVSDLEGDSCDICPPVA